MAFHILGTVKDNWYMFSPVERRNIAIYILGIMLYKFGLEAFNGSVVALATNRYDYDAFKTHSHPKTFERVGLLTGLNQAFQCIGSILIAPLVRRASSRVVLAVAIFVFGLFTALLLVLDASTGGTFVPVEFRKHHPSMDFHYYGHYDTDGMIPIYCVTGVVYGMVELIRRVIPRDIVGGNVQKLRRMDSLVHVFYEISGTAGAFCTALALIPQLGNNYSFIITPVCFCLAGCVWLCITDTTFQQPAREKLLSDQPTYIKAVFGSFYLFGESLWTGAKLILCNRRFVWLIPGYSIAFYGHRYLENSIAPAVARRYLGHSAWSQVIVGGSNLGELLGAAFVFLFTNLITTPIPWIRVDAIMLLILWYLPFWHPPANDVRYAWIVSATFLPISFGWAAGDVSLAAYIQATLARVESKTKNVSALGAVMACLYTTYIVIYAISSPILGQYIDDVYIRTGGSKGDGNIHSAILNVAAIQYSVMAFVIFVSTFVPQGSFALNPKLLFDQNLDSDVEVCEIGSVEMKKSMDRRNTTGGHSDARDSW
ncbi:hypothetical protein CPC735_028950 [Coccidioides posadasii C735 delta SOWgp]|uniref:Major facilitator superfamily domain-containing protein n=4 Tax=Coccidioides posadasii TaxID=199306 RepID=E9CSX2_COCPS|nr:hypothetical protein CPC735_028950 [Coccidioides posadasii C735 delta SOWgp]EER27559.1 hypothetical protein CPC735_028950 [Coccidioides posadasii C735 delta SOWgp]EFW22783.1 conserved hypothetical protein [Coccidioides posadasii str. Silveira]KMM67420.1 hypothetical protein CPAG_03754 [Coccidioides posadasii RMSCC 3488]|eukprot:XP_003069704.1 hypothetical protein CPC735_028950 [Coccidioides posadasii C735 delta SOWgp]